MTDAAEVKERIFLLDMVRQDSPLKKVADTGGGEYAGPCPFCGGEDRFRVHLQAPPGKKPEGSRWMCRHCSTRWGDVIGYVMKREGIGFQDALGILSPQSLDSRRTVDATSSEPPQFDRQQWVATALEFMEECAHKLRNDCGKGALEYLHNRGLNDETLYNWATGYNPTEGYGDPKQWGFSDAVKVWLPKGIVIPCHDEAGLHYIKIRRLSGNPKYYILKGGESWIFGGQTLMRAAIAFLFEGEFDAMLADQTGLRLGYASIPAGQNLKVEWDRFFEPVDDLIVAFDNDEPGQTAADKLCKLSDHFHRSSPFPNGKDLTEYHLSTGNSDDVCLWLLDQLDLLK